MTRYYKSFKPGLIGPCSNKKWPKRIGAWVKVEGKLVPCENGIHVARGERELLEHWLDAEVYEVEVRGERLDEAAKACVRECRLVRQVLDVRSLRLFAADCAEHALTVAGVTDGRSWDVVRVARLYAEGGVSQRELGDAWADALDTARADALDTARAAARAAAWNDARAAAEAAAWNDAWSDGRDAARDRQALILRWYIDGEQGNKPTLETAQ